MVAICLVLQVPCTLLNLFFWCFLPKSCVSKPLMKYQGKKLLLCLHCFLEEKKKEKESKKKSAHMSLILNPSLVMPPLAIYIFHTVRLFKYVKGQKNPKNSSLQEAKMEPFRFTDRAII